jgi:hypothetical protein
MNSLHIGLSKDIRLPKGGFLYIGDEVPKHPLGRVFDPLKDAFNPLRKIDYKKARQLSDVVQLRFPRCENDAIGPPLHLSRSEIWSRSG